MRARQGDSSGGKGNAVVRLFVVDSTVGVEEIGFIVTGKLEVPAERLRIGDPVEVRRRDGSTLRTTITNPPLTPTFPGVAEVMLRGVTRETGIGAGDEVWSDSGEGGPPLPAVEPAA